MLTDAQIATIRKRAANRHAKVDDLDALIADRDELVRRLARMEAAARDVFREFDHPNWPGNTSVVEAVRVLMALVPDAPMGAAPMEDAP